MKRLINYLIFLTLCIILGSCSSGSQKDVDYKPVIISDWWEITGNPDLGEYTSPNQEPVDFGVWQAADGTWQLWSCIRKTNCGGHTRLFHGWEGENLTDTDWRPLGIVMEADTTIGEKQGGLQAPHVIQKDGIYYMLYGGWAQICLAKSTDGKTFKRMINDAETDSWGGGDAECPFVVPIGDKFILFRNIEYGSKNLNVQYCSDDPLYFGVNNDSLTVGELRVAAPEIVQYNGAYYIFALKETLDGIRAAKIEFQEVK